MLATGLFATRAVNPGGADGLFNGNPEQLGRQAIAIVVAIVFAAVGTFVVAKITSLLTKGLRSSSDDEENGLDVTEHGEVGYTTEEGGVPSFSMAD